MDPVGKLARSYLFRHFMQRMCDDDENNLSSLFFEPSDGGTGEAALEDRNCDMM